MNISERVGRTFGSFTVYNYRLFSFGQIISLCGTWMQTTAQGWLVLKITNSAVALGTVVALQYFPSPCLHSSEAPWRTACPSAQCWWERNPWPPCKPWCWRFWF